MGGRTCYEQRVGHGRSPLFWALLELHRELAPLPHEDPLGASSMAQKQLLLRAQRAHPGGTPPGVILVIGHRGERSGGSTEGLFPERSVTRFGDQLRFFGSP